MEANKKKYQQYGYGTSYIEGNTVRKQEELRTVPDRRNGYPEREEEYQVPQRRRREQPRTGVISGVSFASLLVLTVAIVATVFVCVDYLMLQHQVSQMDKKIVSMEKDLKQVTDANDAAYEAINTALDLDYVYKVAVEELGMVYPKNNEVITYKSGAKDYVRQYEDIPE